jgi:2-isopropylmalate synthase
MSWERDTFQVYDTTLRDGSQGEGMSFSVSDKLAIAALLDELGVGFIEAGWPGASPKDTEVFRRAQTELELSTSRLVAFGATRKVGASADSDPQVLALLESLAPAITLVAKGSLRHVSDALKTTPEENLAMITDTVGLLVAEGRQVFVDVEHCFDGFDLDAAYTTDVVRAAHEAGADAVVLCDTNGGQLPWMVADTVSSLLITGARLGIHVHDDTGCGPANTLSAVRSGATHVQGAFNGYGERCGNADIVTVIANLSLKMDVAALPPGRLKELTRVSHAIAALSNRPPRRQAPYVGASAFAHKAGLHASALKVHPDLYQHTQPELVGNDMRLLVSDLAGRATIELKGRELGIDLSERPEVVSAVIADVKDKESRGFSYEAAEASFELLLREHLDGVRRQAWETESWRVIVDGTGAEATVKVSVKGERIATVGEGNGPVDALAHALRQALEGTYPALGRLELTDFAVRILEDAHGTGAITRVIITMSDGATSWVTVGVDTNIVEASWQALTDAYTYGLLCR